MWRTTTISLRRCFSTSAAVRSVYELSIDTMKPSKLPTYVNAVGPLLNSSNSKPLGSFTTFLGGQRGEFIYIREHDSGDHLAASRDQLLEKVEELGELWQKCDNQETTVLNPFPWYQIRNPSREGGIFEYRSYTMKPGVMAQWAHRFQQGIEARMEYSQPLGIWFSEIGSLNGVHHIWHYDSLDHRVAVRNQALGNEVWRETVRDTAAFIDVMKSRIVRPTPHSNWK